MYKFQYLLLLFVIVLGLFLFGPLVTPQSTYASSGYEYGWVACSEGTLNEVNDRASRGWRVHAVTASPVTDYASYTSPAAKCLIEKILP